ncbi:hypothetical protein BDZ97DRAFT_1595774, partial [Flammula alnicola]
LLQLRSGHIPLNAHLNRFKCVETNKCQACLPEDGSNPAVETVIHYLFECPAYEEEWFDLDRALG